MKKQMVLCDACAEKMGECFDLKQISRLLEKKPCEQCCRKRYGAEYAVGRKAAKK